MLQLGEKCTMACETNKPIVSGSSQNHLIKIPSEISSLRVNIVSSYRIKTFYLQHTYNKLISIFSISFLKSSNVRWPYVSFVISPILCPSILFRSFSATYIFRTILKMCAGNHAEYAFQFQVWPVEYTSYPGIYRFYQAGALHVFSSGVLRDLKYRNK